MGIFRRVQLTIEGVCVKTASRLMERCSDFLIISKGVVVFIK